jgi:DNA polymerase III subunit epsilon
MEWFTLLVVVALVVFIAVLVLGRRGLEKPQRRPWESATTTTATALQAALPERFVVFDLETTGLDAKKNEIIEIGAIRVNRDSAVHDTFQALVKPGKRIPKNIERLTGITHAMLDTEGEPLASALQGFRDFIGDLPLVCFNAEFDMAFLAAAGQKHGIAFANHISCALIMSRRAWPGRKSYRLADLARDGNLSSDGPHRALADCQRALIVYAAAASEIHENC